MSITVFMSGREVGENPLPQRYFSSLYYDKQQNRGLPNEPSLPTAEDLAELEKLKTDYEGKRYDIPQEMLDITNSKKKFDEIDQARQEAGLGSKDIRFFRQHVIDNKQSDYDYRYWLQYEVESMAAGQRSMRILTERDTEFEQAMKKLYEYSLNISKSLVSLSERNSQKELTRANKNAFGLLKIWNNAIAEDQTSFKLLKNSKRFDAEFESEDSELQNQIKENPLFYLVAKECISVLFRSLNQVRRLRSLKKIREEKDELKQYLPNIDFEVKQGETKKDADRSLRAQLNEELSKQENSSIIHNFYYDSFVCETNSLFKKLVNRVDLLLTSWFEYIGNPNDHTSLEFSKSITKRFLGSSEFYQPEKSQDDIDVIREKCIRIVTACFVTLDKEEIIEVDIGHIEELDYLYSKEYDNKGSHPNVVRLTRKICEELNHGDHAIIRHFQEDEKRNLYCLPKEHHKYDIQKTAGNGGFLHHGSKSVSLHYDLLSLVRAKEYDFTRFEPSEKTLDTLNILQKTQWSLNLDFLHFIADFTLNGKRVDGLLNIRHAAWTSTNNMKLREIFKEMMELDLPDTPTKSRLRTINSSLKQARKNLLNSGNVFWHAWFCDWRGRFNARVTQLSPQGGDLSKSLLLFTEWKILGESGKKWLYVKAYDFMYKIIVGNKDNQTHKFEEQQNWVESNKYKILEISSKLNRKTSDEDLKETLERLQVKKPGHKSEIFQRIAFLIEFYRIHQELEKNNDNWDQVSSGLPIHLDASCNGFQHIAALTRNRKLAKSTNILSSDDDNEKGDLYQEVASKAIELYYGNGEEQLAKPIKKLFEEISKSKEEQELLVKHLFSRDICKPLVMITGYGAKELKDPLMNLNGKKNKPGWYKTGLYKEGKKDFKRTTHIESILYKKIEQMRGVKKDGFKKLEINYVDGLLTPVESCELLNEIVVQLTKYIKKCIGKVTNNGFEVVNNKLKRLYQDLDSIDNLSLSNLKKLKGTDLDDKLNKKKKLLYFCWKVSPEASLVRNVRWKAGKETGKAVLDKRQVLPEGYVSSSKEVIIQFILDNNESMSKEMLERLNYYREEENRLGKELAALGKELAANSRTNRKLSIQINRCLDAIGKNSSIDEETRKAANNHYYSRRLSKSKSGRLRINTGKLIGFNQTKRKLNKEETAKRIKLLDSMSTDVERGLVPNFIHSFDAMHMQMIIQELSKNEINDIWAVHDSFGVHACHVEKMRDIVKKTFVELHKDPLRVHIENIRKENEQQYIVPGKKTKDSNSNIMNAHLEKIAATERQIEELKKKDEGLKEKELDIHKNAKEINKLQRELSQLKEIEKLLSVEANETDMENISIGKGKNSFSIKDVLKSKYMIS